MDKNTVIGFGLIFALLLAVSYFNQPGKEELEKRKNLRDSLAIEQLKSDSLSDNISEDQTTTITTFEPVDSIQQETEMEASLVNKFGVFAPAARGEEKEFVLENELLRVVFSSKGGSIKEAELKEYKKQLKTEKGFDKAPLKLLEDEKNKFEYLLPVSSAESKTVYTSDLYFEAEQKAESIIFRAQAGNGRYFEQSYTLGPDSYRLDYDVRFVGLDEVIPRTDSEIALHKVNYLDKLEKNAQYEATFSTIYFKEITEDPSYCSCRKSDTQVPAKPLKWISDSNQFFNSTLIADESFTSAELVTEMFDLENEDLKKLESTIRFPYNHSSDETFSMHYLLAPNEFTLLKSQQVDLEDIIPFGWSIFGWINRTIIRPLFGFLSSFIGSAGIVILILTLFVKMALYPLTYKMLHSQAKMGALKPQLEALREKIGDDAQAMQVEQMKLYRETGVNPLGGCMPMVLQMPIWFALYRFFPASIKFRQESFLWADDLSSFDSIYNLGFEIPFYGAHISLFTLLWAGTTVIYTYYNSKHMDFGSNPMMKYIQFFMPVMFLFFFNSYASGLTCYLFFSNIFNIGQTIATKKWIFDDERMAAELEENKKKPKKKGGFQAKLEQAMKEQQSKKAQIEMEKAKQRKLERTKKKK